MNRTFLIFLMVGTALMIAVMGRDPSSSIPGYMPWEIKVLDNGHVLVFGITLEKTRIQDANQILSSFPDTRLTTDQQQVSKLTAVYDELSLGGLLAQIELQYDINEDELKKLQQIAVAQNNLGYSKLPEEVELNLLDSTVKSLTYRPAVDYDIDIILQRFGQADKQQKISEQSELWIYLDRGLTITIDNQGPDVFHYTSVRPLPRQNS